MPTLSPTAVTERIQQLLAQRQQHADALVRIDSILKQVGAVLQPEGRQMTKAPTGGRGGRRRRRGKFSMSGEQSIIALIKSKGGASSQEIERHWKGEGRGGFAANELSKMTKAKKLKRTPLKGERGSRYTLP